MIGLFSMLPSNSWMGKQRIKQILRYSSRSSQTERNKNISILNDKFKNSDTTWTSIVSMMALQLFKIANTSPDDVDYAAFLRRYFCELFDFMKYLFRHGLDPSIHYTSKGDKYHSFASMDNLFKALKQYYVHNDAEVIKQINEILCPHFSDIIPSVLTVLLTKEDKKHIKSFWFGSMLGGIHSLTPNMLQSLLLMGYPMINVVYTQEPSSLYDHSKYVDDSHNMENIQYNNDLCNLCVMHGIAREALWDLLYAESTLPYCVMNTILNYHMGSKIKERAEIRHIYSKNGWMWHNMDWFCETLIINKMQSMCVTDAFSCMRIRQTIQRPLRNYKQDTGRYGAPNWFYFDEIFSLMQNANGLDVSVPSRMMYLLINKLHEHFSLCDWNYHLHHTVSAHVIWIRLLENNTKCFYSDGWCKLLDSWASQHCQHTITPCYKDRYVMETILTKYYWFEDKHGVGNDPIWCFVQLLLTHEYFQQVFVDYNYLQQLCLHKHGVHKIKLLVHYDLIPIHYALNADYIISIIRTIIIKHKLQCIQLLLQWSLQQCKKYKNIHGNAQKYAVYLDSVREKCDIFTEYRKHFQRVL